MATFLRDLYVQLGTLSTRDQTEVSRDLLKQFEATGSDNLAGHFVNSLRENYAFNQITQPFIPLTRGKKTGRNPVVKVMKLMPWMSFSLPSTAEYEFKFLQREIPHLRALTKREQKNKAWIDYVARTSSRPILGEIKWRDDKNPFYAFIQLLTYLSEMATPNQIQRAVKHKLFEDDIEVISPFDLHILLVNFNDRGEKGPLIDLTQRLARAFSNRVIELNPDVAKCVGSILCISGHIEGESQFFSSLTCRWAV